MNSYSFIVGISLGSLSPGLLTRTVVHYAPELLAVVAWAAWRAPDAGAAKLTATAGFIVVEIGRASCRERVVSIRVDLGGRRIIKKKIGQYITDYSSYVEAIRVK